MNDNFVEWVESMGVASGRGKQEMSVASGWFLESMGVVTMYRCG